MSSALLLAAQLIGCAAPPTPALDFDLPERVGAPVQVGVTVHLEARDVDSQAVFEGYASQLRERAAIFEAYDAPLTLETKVMTDGVEMWGDNVLLEMQDRGHAIGVHADLGGRVRATTEDLAETMTSLRERNEDLGLDVRHVSGICSHADWVTAALDAGFEFTSSVVTYCLQSLPEERRPPDFVDCANPSECHEAFPFSMEKRLTPSRVVDGATWTEADPSGAFVVMPAQGSLTCLAETGAGEESPTNCDFGAEDVESWRLGLDRAIEIAEPGQVSDFHISWSFGDPLTPELITLWLETMDRYRQAGLIQWRTLPEVHDAFRAQ